MLRAETNLDTRPDFSLRDLDQALQLQATNSRAHWLRCRVLASFGEYDKAVAAGAEAIRLEPQEGALPGDASAGAGASRAAEGSGRRGREGRRAQRRSARTSRPAPSACWATWRPPAPSPITGRPCEYHTQAIKLAEPLATSKHPAVRVAAKEVLLDAHLGAAHDIAWGTWREKEKAVDRLAGQGRPALADDLIKTRGRRRRVSLPRRHPALAVCVGLRGKLDPAPWINQAARQRQGPDRRRRRARPASPTCNGTWAWPCTTPCRSARCAGRSDEAPQATARWRPTTWKRAARSRLSADNAYLLGRLYFRLGAIHAVGDKNHRTAVGWFDKALPLLEKTPAGAKSPTWAATANRW